MKVYDSLLNICKQQGAGFLILLDPDSGTPAELADHATICESSGAEALLIGGSSILRDHFCEAVAAVKQVTSLPLIIFPGNPGQLSPDADALLFLSLISGRNPQHLIGDQIIAAPAVKQMELEAISTGYMLVESGNITAVEYISDTKPLPRNKPGVAAATALAGQCLGLKLIYLEAGSGADQSVPEEMIAAVRAWIDLPIIVGGGIRTPAEAASKVGAGADFIVIGTVFENDSNASMMKEYCDAIHEAGEQRTKL